MQILDMFTVCSHLGQVRPASRCEIFAAARGPSTQKGLTFSFMLCCQHLEILINFIVELVGEVDEIMKLP